MHFDYLASDLLHMIDVQVTPTQVNAGWVYLTGGRLDKVERLTDGEILLDIRIHPKIQEIKTPTEFFLANDVIEFMRCQN